MSTVCVARCCFAPHNDFGATSGSKALRRRQMTRGTPPKHWAAISLAAFAAVTASLAVGVAVAEQPQEVQKRASRQRAGLLSRQLGHGLRGSPLLEHFTFPSPGAPPTTSAYIEGDPAMPTQTSLNRLHFYRGDEGETPPRESAPFAASKRQHRYEMGARPVGHSGHGEEELSQWKLIHYCKKHYGAWKNCPLASYIKEPRH